jgi:hypothetical protein
MSATGYSLGVTFIAYDFADGDPVGVSRGAFDMAHQGLRYVPMRISARYGELYYWTNGADEPWDIGGHEVKVSPVGSR